MIGVIHQTGTSFKGLAAYLLHDKGANTSARVSWTHTHNLATENPDAAWKVQAATAMQQADLKQAAGVKNTGRKSAKSVMHYTLSWHPEERGELTRDEMLSATLGSMRYLGTSEGERLSKTKKAQRTQYADEHQAVIVCHDEGPDAPMHVHVMLNRVHPVHGVMLPDSKDYEKLSRWAGDYREAQGKGHYCPARQQNAAKKAQGLKTSDRRVDRPTYEQDRAIEEAPPESRKKAVLEEQKRRKQALAQKTARLKENQTAAVRELEDFYDQNVKTIKAKTGRRIKAATSKIRAEHAPKIEKQIERQADELAAFEAARGTATGHVRNAWAALKTKQWMTEIRTRPLHAMKAGFAVAVDSGLQFRDIQIQHDRETKRLNGDRLRKEKAAAKTLRAEERVGIAALRVDHRMDRADLLLRQSMDAAKLKAQWKQLDHDRRLANQTMTVEQAPNARSERAAFAERRRKARGKSERDLDRGDGRVR